MRRTRIIADRDAYEDDVAGYRSVQRAPWSPAQVVALLVGGVLTLVGGVALARTGLDFGHLTSNRAEVLGLGHTTLLALIELLVGLALVGAGASPGAHRSTMTFAGVVLIGFGVLVAAQPSAFAGLGVTEGNGWFYLIAGIVLLVAAMVSPVVYDADRRAVSRRVEAFDR